MIADPNTWLRSVAAPDEEDSNAWLQSVAAEPLDAAEFWQSIRQAPRIRQFVAPTTPVREAIPELEGGMVTSPLQAPPQLRRAGPTPAQMEAAQVPELEKLKNAADQFVNHFLRSIGASSELVGMAAKELNDLFRSHNLPSEGDKDLEDFVTYQWGRAIKDFADRHFQADPRLRADFLSQTLPAGAGSMAAFMLGGVGAKVLRGSVGAATALMGAALEGTQQYEDAKAMGASDEDAQTAARWGALIGTSEAWPILKILKRFDKAAGGKLKSGLRAFLSETARQGGSEATQEFFQTLAGNVVAKQIYDKERDLVEGAVEAAKSGGVLGALAAAIAMAAGVGLRGLRGRVAAEEAQQAGRMAAPAAPTEPGGPQIPPEAAEARIPVPKHATGLATPEGAAAFARAYPELAREFAALDKLSRTAVQKTPATPLRVSADLRASFLKHLKAATLGELSPRPPTPMAVPDQGAVVPPPPRPSVVSRETAGVTPTVVVPHAEPQFGIPTGIVSGADLADTVTKGVSSARRFGQRFFTSRGNLPKPIFERKIARDGAINAALRGIVYRRRDYRKAAREAYAGKGGMSEADVQQVNAVLNGKAASSTIPEAMRPVVAAMRAEIDTLSRRMIALGVVEGDIVGTITKNLETYLHRSYRAFDNPKWVPPSEVVEKAKALVRKEYPDLSEAELQGHIDALLFKAKDAATPMALLVMAKLGAKDLSIFKRLQDIPPEIRALWGEYKDPIVNYVKSVERMARVIANHQFLTDVREAHLGTLFHEKPITDERGAFVARISAEASEPMRPLNGLHTTEVIRDAFTELFATRNLPDWLTQYMRVNGVVKFSKTVGSLMTHIRNALANSGFAVANGHWRVWKMGTAIPVALTDLGAKNSAKWRAYFQRLLRLGVVHESARAGEIHDVIQDAMKGGPDEFSNIYIKRMATQALHVATGVYRAEDDVWKIFAFENERARYRKALRDLSEDQVDEIAARIVRNTYPTYSLVPEGVKMMRRFPAVGTFVSFPAEVMRTGYNTIELAAREMADPRLRHIGTERAVGILVAASGTAAIAAASRMLFGVTKEEDEAKRQFVAPWTENSQLIHLGTNDKGQNEFIDISYTDPYEYVKTPAIALLRGEDWQSALWDATLEAMAPFAGEEILAGAIFDIVRNKKKTGGQVYNPQAELPKRFAQAIEHLSKALEPGTVSSARRIIRGITGYVTPYGRGYDPKLESLAVFTGQRIQQLDEPTSLRFRARSFLDDIRQAGQLAGHAYFSRGKVSASELAGAYKETEEAYARLYVQMRTRVKAAQTLGMSRAQVNAILEEAGLSTEWRYQLLNDSRFDDAYLSDRLYRATSPSAKSEDRDRVIRLINALSYPASKAEWLLEREARWKRAKGNVAVWPSLDTASDSWLARKKALTFLYLTAQIRRRREKSE